MESFRWWSKQCYQHSLFCFHSKTHRIFPILDILPDALAPWRAKAREAHEREAKVRICELARPFRLTRELQLFGLWAEEARNPVPGALQAESLVAQLWRTQETLGMDDKTIAYVGNSLYFDVQRASDTNPLGRRQRGGSGV